MIYKNKHDVFISDLYGEPQYAHCCWKQDCAAVTIVSASGMAEVDINWADIPLLVSDLLVLYEKARLSMLGKPCSRTAPCLE